jgi:predicted metal-dependent HD superfamily phosphohydrolase
MYMNAALRDTFLSLMSSRTPDASAAMLWEEIARRYSEKGRHYHTLDHLANMLEQLESCRHLLQDRESVQAALFYHDIIYNPQRGDNEAQSAGLAEERLRSVSFPGEKISACCAHILATKDHTASGDMDTDLFTDADLSVLGQEWEGYAAYAEAVRKEYRIYPDMVYRPGRRKVLIHFLKMDRIFKTAFFGSLYEAAARQNLGRELEALR